MTKPPETPVNTDKFASEFITKLLRQSETTEPGNPDHTGLAELEGDSEHKNLEIIFLRSEIDRYNEDTKLRRQYANRVYWFMVFYTVFVAFVIVASGLLPFWEDNGIPIHFKLNDMPLSTLIGGAFASAVGLVAFVIKGLFPRREKPDKG